MKTTIEKPTSVRLEKSLSAALSGISSVTGLSVGKIMQLAVKDYFGRIELGRIKLPVLGESISGTASVGDVIKKYRSATKTETPSSDQSIPDPLELRLASIEARLAALEGKKISPASNRLQKEAKNGRD